LVPGRRKQRALLALLLLRGNTPVPVESIVDVLWGQRRPASAIPNLQSYVADLRRLLRSAEPAAEARLSWQGGGYQLLVGPDELDAAVFQDLATAGRKALRAGDPAIATQRLSRALGLWRGRVLEGLDVPVLAPDQARLEELRLLAVEDDVDARLALGQHEELPAELEALVGQQPLRERMSGQLMLALYRAGRRADALAAYEQAYARLDGELGLPPGPALRQLHERILAADGTLDPPPRTGMAADDLRRVVPAQLPTDVRGFTGRAAELCTLDGLLAGSAGPGVPGPVLIFVVAGAAGVGKSALAVHWAHRVAARFPDGQLYVNLHGYNADPAIEPAVVLGRFLRALGVPGDDVPEDPDERAGRYRTELAGRRALVLLDNAATVQQIQPLLPGAAGCAVVVTSRNALARLVAVHGAHRIDLDPLPPADAAALLRRLIGDRAAVEPAAVRALADQCARLPSTLRIAAELAARRGEPLGRFVAELVDWLRRLDVRDVADDARAAAVVFSSLATLDLPVAAQLRARLAALDGLG
jgi:DNA-binding SARP family transcriptional activator